MHWQLILVSTVLVFSLVGLFLRRIVRPRARKLARFLSGQKWYVMGVDADEYFVSLKIRSIKEDRKDFSLTFSHGHKNFNLVKSLRPLDVIGFTMTHQMLGYLPPFATSSYLLVKFSVRDRFAA